MTMGIVAELMDENKRDALASVRMFERIVSEDPKTPRLQTVDPFIIDEIASVDKLALSRNRNGKTGW